MRKNSTALIKRMNPEYKHKQTFLDVSALLSPPSVK